jgi:hypothetical protein
MLIAIYITRLLQLDKDIFLKFALAFEKLLRIIRRTANDLA